MASADQMPPRGDESLLIVLSPEASTQDLDRVVARLREIDADAHVSQSQTRTIIGAVGDHIRIQQLPWEAFPGVERVVPVVKPFRFVSRESQADDSVVDVGGVSVGGGHVTVIAGPCAVESRDQLFASASAVRKAGAAILRGDAFKPRTSPYSFQGLGAELLR